ncbi:NAD(P)H-binding protein [Marinobacter salinisoli]|uniref:NAD(P)H-binding protein n=1 Tax=Marinobacter salinisoli TaxID=2769486 RepID=A0ABX7MS33_9GAMM|nr:NAD(P)H-binding protein [Marinobacter salinisoli]QSP93911.1 NAD(P)H-binding protein [Marinobacter salinisoli]
MKHTNQTRQSILVVGGTGKTGKRVAEQLKASGHQVRVGSRSAIPSFDWGNEKSWAPCLNGVTSVYITYSPDLAMPGATDAIQAFVGLAKRHGVNRLVLLSGRGEAEAQACEKIVQDSGLEWTIVRASWFNQNFSEGAFIDMVLNGAITLSAGNQVEPFVDVDDIADVAVAALTQDHHNRRIYEVTGPRLMTFADVASDISRATGREVAFIDVPHTSFIAEMESSGTPEDVVWMLDYLFATVLDGRNAHLTDGVQQALGREPKDFAAFAEQVAKTGIWDKR